MMGYVSHVFSKHAEEECIRTALKYQKNKISESILYLMKIDENNNPIPCECCDRCYSLMEKFKVKVVYVTNDS